MREFGALAVHKDLQSWPSRIHVPVGTAMMHVHVHVAGVHVALVYHRTVIIKSAYFMCECHVWWDGWEIVGRLVVWRSCWFGGVEALLLGHLPLCTYHWKVQFVEWLTTPLSHFHQPTQVCIPWPEALHPHFRAIVITGKMWVTSR